MLDALKDVLISRHFARDVARKGPKDSIKFVLRR